MIRTKYIHEYNVKYDDGQHHIDGGIYYLNDILNHMEAKVFFDAARHNGEAEFKNNDNHTFVLTYQYKDGHDVYTLISASSY